MESVRVFVGISRQMGKQLQGGKEKIPFSFVVWSHGSSRCLRTLDEFILTRAGVSSKYLLLFVILILFSYLILLFLSYSVILGADGHQVDGPTWGRGSLK